jgi:hypothetical protein
MQLQMCMSSFDDAYGDTDCEEPEDGAHWLKQAHRVGYKITHTREDLNKLVKHAEPQFKLPFRNLTG